MRVSVITIAKTKEELGPLREILKKQTYKDFEFVYSTRKGIPQAWNDAIMKAKGEILLITESDVMPLSNRWIEDMVGAAIENGDKAVVRGIEVIPSPWCFSNLACYSKILKANKLDESYPVGEDTELFSRLNDMGYKGVELSISPVLHIRKFKGFFKEVKNAYLYGKFNTRTNRRYQKLSFNQNPKVQNILIRELTTIISRVAFMIGIIRGLS